MFTAKEFTIAEVWKELMCPRGDKYMKKLWFMYTMENYSPLRKGKIL